MKTFVLMVLGALACVAALSVSARAETQTRSLVQLVDYEGGSCEELRQACKNKNQMGDSLSSGDYYCRKYQERCAPRMTYCQRLRARCREGYSEEACQRFREECRSDGYNGNGGYGEGESGCRYLRNACHREEERGDFSDGYCRRFRNECR